MAETLPSLAFLGAGAMGGAILHGVLDSGITIEGEIVATNHDAERARAVAAPGVRSIALDAEPDANAAAVAQAGIVLIGVKPDTVPDLLHQIAPHLPEQTIVVSYAAGVPLALYEQALGAQARVIRAMPNTPAMVRRAVTGLARGGAATAEDMALIRRLFETVGAVVEVPEEQIDALTSISGSGPAYVFLLIEELTRAAEAKGFTRDQARLLAEQTFIGSTALLDTSGEDPVKLRHRVTSPNGTTERAVAVLQRSGLDQIFTEATDAALARAREMAAGD